jgi:hypothetical protein
MAATFTLTGDWFGTIDANYETANAVANAPAPADGFAYKRKIYLITRARSGQELTAFSPNVGGTTTGDNLCIVNGPDTICGSADDTYLLQKDAVVPTPQNSGIWEEQQIAVSYGEWELYEIDP